MRVEKILLKKRKLWENKYTKNSLVGTKTRLRVDGVYRGLM